MSITAATKCPVLLPSQTSTKPTLDDVKSWGHLTATQQSLFKNGRPEYEAMSNEQKAVFLTLTTLLANNEVDLTGVTLLDPAKTTRRNRLLFENTEGLVSVRGQLEDGVEDGRFLFDLPSAKTGHKGHEKYGVRENTLRWPFQFGIGDAGAFVDADEYNYLLGKELLPFPIMGKRVTTGAVGHCAELVRKVPRLAEDQFNMAGEIIRKVSPNPEFGARAEEWMRTLAAGNASPLSLADSRDLDIFST